MLGYGQQAGGTHPTGMQFRVKYFCQMLKVLKIKHGGEIEDVLNVEENMKYWGKCAHCKASFTRTINVTVFVPFRIGFNYVTRNVKKIKGAGSQKR